MTAAIVCSDLSFSWPDGAPVLSELTVLFGPGRTGLIGVNGSGKSTLLRLIAGELLPSSGAVRARGEVGYLPQAITLGTHRSVSDLLGITAARNALHAIEAGESGEAAFAAVGDDWDVEERARAWLDRLALGSIGLDDRVERLSGGETILVALAALFLRRPEIMLLDEPTNNLDLDARKRLYDAVAAWSGVMIIVSHDRELLGLVDQIADLSGGEIRMYGGNLAAYEERLAAEQAAAERAVTAAAADVRREHRDFVDAQVKQARRDRMGRKVAASGGLPRIVAYARKRAAQETAGRSRELHAERLQAARDRLDEAEQSVRDDAEIRIELPGTAVPAGRTVLTVTGLTGPHWHPASAADLARAGLDPVRAAWILCAPAWILCAPAWILCAPAWILCAPKRIPCPPRICRSRTPLSRACSRSSSFAGRNGSPWSVRTARARPPCSARSRAWRDAPVSRSGWVRWSATCRSGSTSSTTRSAWSTMSGRRLRPHR